MPWKNDNGGGWQGGGNRGPWGQGPSGPSGGGRKPSPQDFDDLLQRLQDMLRGLLPSGGRGSWLVPLILVAGFWLYKSLYQVQADETGLVLRFGAYTRAAGPGLHVAVWPIEQMEMVPVLAEQRLSIGESGDEGLMLTGDQNMVEVKFKVLWKISDPVSFQFNIADQNALVQAVAESAMREVVGRTPADEALTSGRLSIQEQVQSIIQTTLDNYNAGIQITGLALENVDPPQKVLDAFEEVQRAQQNQQNLINEAEQYSNQKLREVEGKAAALIEDAKGYKARVVAESQGESQRFVKIYEQYAKAKDVTRQRLFLETMENILSQSNNVIVEGGQGSGILPYLPLPEIQKRSAPPALNSTQGATQQ